MLNEMVTKVVATPANTEAQRLAAQAEKEYTYLTTQELLDRLHYNVIAVHNELKDSMLIEGLHYFRFYQRSCNC